MKIKVCGIKHPNNLRRLTKLDLDLIGFNFYPSSKRYIDKLTDLELALIPNHIKRVGVFVNASIETLKNRKDAFKLDYLQLHGDESIAAAKAAQALCPVIKVFRVGLDFDFSITDDYNFADLFLFDTYTKDFGGSGTRFDWNQLNKYAGKTPFLLAGGITPKDVTTIKAINHPLLYGVDINSGFEIEPGLKDENLVKQFIQQLNSKL